MVRQAAPEGDRICGIRVDLRYVQEHDAAFIFALRSDPELSRHLSRVSGGVGDQEAWISRYKDEEARGLQHYFVVERKDHTPCGLVRLYNVDRHEFTWGSFIIGPDAPPKAALETALLSFGFGFDVLGCALAILDVRRDNERAIAFYRRFGMHQTGSDDLDLFFELSRQDFEARRESLQRAVSRDG